MSMSSINGSQRTVLVDIGIEGNIALRCSVCDEIWLVSVRLSASPFWEVFVGSALLTAIQHTQEAH